MKFCIHEVLQNLNVSENFHIYSRPTTKLSINKFKCSLQNFLRGSRITFGLESIVIARSLIYELGFGLKEICCGENLIFENWILSKICLKLPLKIEKTKISLTNGSLMNVTIIAKCSPSAIF